MLLARKGNTMTMHSVASNKIKNFVVLFSSRPKGTTSSWDIMKQVLDRDLCALATSTWLRIGTLSGL